MHEVALVRAIIQEIEKQASVRKARRVNNIRIRFNSLTSHSADHVRFAFEITRKESERLKDSSLELNEVPPLLLCRCGHEFDGHHLPDACPRCGSLEVKPVYDTNLVLENFEMES